MTVRIAYTITRQMENLTIEVIAEKRGLVIDTIIGHIEKLHSLKQIDNDRITSLKHKIPEKDFEIIFSELNKAEDGKLKPLYEKFEGKYSYGDLKLVRLFLTV